ncbi:MAG: DUF456 domain-containing protein [Bacilli bacterium]
MSIFIWLLVVACFVVGFLGLVYPVLPSVVAIWAGFLIYQLFMPGADLGLLFWIGMTFITVILTVLDFLTQHYFMKKAGGTKTADRLGMIAIIVGGFVFPPFGLILVPFVVVWLAEMYEHRDTKQALKVSLASVASFLTSTVSKLIFQIVMIILFFVAVAF